MYSQVCHDLSSEPFLSREMAESAIRQFVIWSLALFALCLFRRVTRRARTSCPEAACWDHQVTGEVHTRYKQMPNGKYKDTHYM